MLFLFLFKIQIQNTLLNEAEIKKGLLKNFRVTNMLKTYVQHIHSLQHFEHAIVVLCGNVCLPLSKSAQIQFLQKNY